MLNNPWSHYQGGSGFLFPFSANCVVRCAKLGPPTAPHCQRSRVADRKVHTTLQLTLCQKKEGNNGSTAPRRKEYHQRSISLSHTRRGLLHTGSQTAPTVLPLVLLTLAAHRRKLARAVITWEGEYTSARVTNRRDARRHNRHPCPLTTRVPGLHERRCSFHNNSVPWPQLDSINATTLNRRYPSTPKCSTRHHHQLRSPLRHSMLVVRCCTRRGLLVTATTPAKRPCPWAGRKPFQKRSNAKTSTT